MFLVLAGICFVLSLLVGSRSRNDGALYTGVIIAIVLVIAYFASRRQVLSFASAGTTITVIVMFAAGMRMATAIQFIELAEAAKNARYLLGREQSE
jgi:hypothetical protein